MVNGKKKLKYSCNSEFHAKEIIKHIVALLVVCIGPFQRTFIPSHFLNY